MDDNRSSESSNNAGEVAATYQVCPQCGTKWTGDIDRCPECQRHLTDKAKLLQDAAAKVRRTNPIIEDGIQRLQTYWPQSHYEQNKHGHCLVFVPGVLLPRGWDKTICTVLFVIPPGFPGACPDHFFTDIEVRLASKNWPKNTNVSNGHLLESLGWPQWKTSLWWSWHLLHWNPNRDGLFTYMKVIQKRLTFVR